LRRCSLVLVGLLFREFAPYRHELFTAFFRQLVRFNLMQIRRRPREPFLNARVTGTVVMTITTNPLILLLSQTGLTFTSVRD
jgi:hypothetical protein